VKDKSPLVGPGPQGFCMVFGPVSFFVGDFFFSMWAFLALTHMGQGKPGGLDQIDTKGCMPYPFTLWYSI